MCDGDRMERLPDDLAHAYLALLAVDAQPGASDAAVLQRLHSAHLARVPFETLDIVRGRPPGIDPVGSVRRIVDGRGGYCYHLNGAFSTLLFWLGFDVTRHVAGVQRRGEAAPGPNASHLGLTVRTSDGREWLVDVGLGDGPSEPLELVEGEHRQDGEWFRLGPSSYDSDGWRFDHDPRGFVAGFDMASGSAVVDDFAGMHAALSSESHFARILTAQRRVRSRVEILRGCVLTERSPHGTRVTEISDGDSWWDVLTGHFGLAYGDVPRDERRLLWTQALAVHEASKARRSG